MSETLGSPVLAVENLGAYHGGTNLSFEGVMEHVIDSETGVQYLRLYPEVPYPTPSPDEMLDDLTLPEKRDAHGNRYLVLPELFSTLEEEVREIAHDESDVSAIRGTDLFTQLGDELNSLIEADEVIPVQLHARQLIVVSDGEWRVLQILPPLVMQPTDSDVYSPRDLRALFVRQLYNSLYFRVESKQEKDILPVIFKGFVETLRLGK